MAYKVALVFIFIQQYFIKYIFGQVILKLLIIKMEIDRIKINDYLMDSIVDSLFNPLESVEDLIGFDLPISKESIDKFILEWNKLPERIGSELPYISFISDNSNNDLRVYIQAHSEDYKVNINNVRLRTMRYIKIGNFYSFDN